MALRARRVRKKCNVICDVLVTNFFFPFLSHFTGHVFEPFLRKCGESQLALFWGKILVSLDHFWVSMANSDRLF